MPVSDIVVKGAREHNLCDVSVTLPRNQLICMTGVSGSGKSSLAFDTVFAEGQRRYIESLSSFARQFLGQMPKPDVDLISGLSPTISISQKTAGRNPRSTVGTITEIYDFLRVLYSRVGTGYCPQCDRKITAQSLEQIVSGILILESGTRFSLLAPLIRGQKGEHKDLFEDLLRQGYIRIRADGQIFPLSDPPSLDRRRRHDIEVVVDRLQIKSDIRSRLTESVEQALKIGDGTLFVALETDEDVTDKIYSSEYACTECGISFPTPSPQLFSFNSPRGMCQKCDGLGTLYSFDENLLIPDTSLSFMQGCIDTTDTWKKMGRWRRHIYKGVAETMERIHDFPEGLMLETPWADLPQQARDIWLWGAGDHHITFTWRGGNAPLKYGGTFDGIIPELKSKYTGSKSKVQLRQLEKYMRTIECPTCDGQRLVAQARSVKLESSHPQFEQSPWQSLPDVCALSVKDAADFFDQIKLGPTSAIIAEEALKEICGRLSFLLNVGLDYLALDRTAPTLSGGEAQRIRLAAQIGSGLVGVLYILDEPSIGLHPRDNDRLLQTLKHLRDIGNTVVVVEHDEDTMRTADYLVDFGPGAGICGGEIVARGSIDEIEMQDRSVTGQFLAGKREIEIPPTRRPQNGETVTVREAAHNNLKSVDVEIPTGNLVCITGVSGSGKSSLVNDILVEALRRDLNNGLGTPGDHAGIDGMEYLDKMIAIDQSPIGRTPRSNPATYIKVFDDIRNLFSQLPDAKRRGYKPGRFSFNVKGGRCEACEGNGTNRLEMDFLADVWVTCPVCNSNRFNRETLQVQFKGHSIADVLEMEIGEALELFENIPKIYHKLSTLKDVGLEYIKLGQPSPTLSGGEAQRIKLAKELVKKSTGQTLYLLDEPTTGLHFADIQMLLKVLHAFVDSGNTVLIVEHNLDVIKTADWVIDLGPEGGEDGGEIVCQGTPEQVADCEASFTGRALARVLRGEANPAAERKRDQELAAKADRELKRIKVTGARQHNLKMVDTEIARDHMTVFSGPSGSGKTSLAMDTIYAEGQRRYVESLSSYARQFINQMQKPQLDYIEGLSPAIAIEQKNLGHTPRSTVGTVTEIYDYLRILMARCGVPHCPDCDIEVGTQAADQIIDKVLDCEEGTRMFLMAPVELDPGQEYEQLWDEIRTSGFQRVRIDRTTYRVDEIPELDRRSVHHVTVVVDRITAREGDRSRIAESIELALQLGKGEMEVALVNESQDETQWEVIPHSQHLACNSCGRSFEHLTPHHFSFNSNLGWCSSCEGIGIQTGANLSLMIPDTRLTLAEGVLKLWPDLENRISRAMLEALGARLGVPTDLPFEKLTPRQRRIMLHGGPPQWIEVQIPADGSDPARKFSFQFKGLYPALAEASRLSASLRSRLEHLIDEVECSTCGGSRIRDDAGAYRFRNETVETLCRTPLGDLLSLVNKWELDDREQLIAGELLREIKARLEFLNEIGLFYLSLNRPSATLSNGEAQRIRLASQLGSGLCGVLYVLDEPTIGLHPRDNGRLLRALHKLRDLGNTLLVVEHDREVIEGSDYLYDFGPGSGSHGGQIVAHGSIDEVSKHKGSVTGPYLKGKKSIPIPENRRPVINSAKSGSQWLEVIEASHNNLKHVNLRIPLGTLTAITGPSGSGKSSLIDDTLYPALARRLHRASLIPGAHERIDGLEYINKVIRVDQNPLGNSPSSNPATYTGMFDLIRELFSKLPDAKIRGYTARRFSFNVPGGRCDDCDGQGQKCIEMHFLPDVWVPCETCEGKRYNDETLTVQFRGHSISDVLAMTCKEALELFDSIPKIRKILQTLCDVGLDYLTLGQSAPTLSGGEAQRVKLAAELSRPDTGQTLYLLDEPTTGLHFDDLRKLLDVLQRLVDLGNTVVVIEHNLDLIKSADWIIDIGPEAGEAGGQIVGQGTPEALSKKFAGKTKRKVPSHTAKALAPVLDEGPYEKRVSFDPSVIDAEQEGDLSISDVGDQASMPWEVDGLKWHTVDRVGRRGEPCRWDGKILAEVIQRIEKHGSFSDTDYSSRTVVEIAAQKKSQGWFFHAITAEAWLLKMKFRTATGTFRREQLVPAMGLKTLNQMDELPVYGNEPRVKVKSLRGPWQEVEIRAHSWEEIDNPVFWEFIETAAKGFAKVTDSTAKDPNKHTPWKKAGQQWHFSRKGFTGGRNIQWPAEVWEDLYGLLHSLVPDGQFLWNNKVLVHLYQKGGRMPWVTINTKKAEDLVLIVNTPTGQTTTGRIADLGRKREVGSGKADRDHVKIYFRSVEDIYSGDLESFLREQMELEQ